MIVFPLRSWARNTRPKKTKVSRTFLENSDPSSPSKRRRNRTFRLALLFSRKKAQNEVQTPACFFLSLSLVSLSKGEESLVWFTHCNKNCASFITTSSFYPLWRFIILAKKKTFPASFRQIKIKIDPFSSISCSWKSCGLHTQISFPSKAYSTVIAILVDCSLSFLKLLNLLTLVIVSNLHSKHPPTPPPCRIIIMTSLFFSLNFFTNIIVPNTLMIITYYPHPPFHRTRFGGLVVGGDKYFLYYIASIYETWNLSFLSSSISVCSRRFFSCRHWVTSVIYFYFHFLQFFPFFGPLFTKTRSTHTHSLPSIPLCLCLFFFYWSFLFCRFGACTSNKTQGTWAVIIFPQLHVVINIMTQISFVRFIR